MPRLPTKINGVSLTDLKGATKKMISSIFIHDTNEGERRMKAEVANILTKIGAAAIVGAIKAVTDAKEASK